MKRGVTLLELLLVMVILAMVMGAGIGMFAGLDTGRRQAVGLVKNVLRTAQNTAIARQSPARVRIDREGGVLVAEALQVVGTWHFEGDLKGAFALDGDGSGASFSDDGFVGQALYLGAGPPPELPVQLDPAFDPGDGFTIDLALRRGGPAGGKVLRIADSCALDVSSAGAVRGWFTPLIVREGHPVPGPKVVVESRPGALPRSRWARVRLEYDRARLVLSVDGVPVAMALEQAPVWRVDAPLVLSDDHYPFDGLVDALVVAVVVADEVAELPESVTFGPEAPAEVRFDAGGALDRRHHPDPVRIPLVYADGTVETVGIGVYGTVDA